MKDNNKNGITLISLIITIIILLILASVVISFTLGKNGIFKLAKQAIRNYTIEAENEEKQIDSLGNYILNVENEIEKDAYIELKIGDYVNYPVYYDNVPAIHPPTNQQWMPKDEYNGWRILSIDSKNKVVKLISAGIPLNYYHRDINATSVGNLTTNFFNTPIASEYYSFYNCGFRTAKDGTTISNINDLKVLFTNEFTQLYGEGEIYTDNGNTYMYTKGNPKVQSITKHDIDNLLGMTTEHGTTINNDILLILNKDTSSSPVNYWTVAANNDGRGIYAISGTGVDSIYMEGNACMGACGVRPVVYLKSNIKFTKSENKINGITTWDIEI